MERVLVTNSLNVREIIYEELNKELFVKFKNNYIYKFNNVPKDVFIKFINSESKGRFVHEHLKDKYKEEIIKMQN